MSKDQNISHNFYGKLSTHFNYLIFGYYICKRDRISKFKNKKFYLQNLKHYLKNLTKPWLKGLIQMFND